MDEKEVISFLKENRNQGIAYPFYPDAVKEWIDKHWYVIIEYSYNHITNSYHWVRHSDNEAAVASNDVYALPEDYVAEEKSCPGRWVELSVDPETGEVNYICGGMRARFYYLDNLDLLIESRYKDFHFKHFGGYQYGGNGGPWFMCPQLIDDQGRHKDKMANDEEVHPEYPVKIRFWKEA